MNKNVIDVYNQALNIVLEDFDLKVEKMFLSNETECVHARTALLKSLTDLGLSDKDIAECTKKMRRCSVCKVRNKYDDKTAPWTVKLCIEHIKKIKANY